MNALSFKRRLLILDECGVSHKFFDFCEAKNQEALKIVMQEGKETSKVIKELFNFWKTNHEEFNSLALEFIYATNKRISNK